MKALKRREKDHKESLGKKKRETMTIGHPFNRSNKRLMQP